MRKGQSRVFEQVLLFGIGVAIFIACFSFFQIYQTEYTRTSMDDQLRGVRDTLYNHILEMSLNEVINSSVVLRIPKRIGGEEYTVTVDDDDITIRTIISGKVVSMSLQMISSAHGGKYSLSGESRSSGGEIIIYKRGYNIIIE